jgi:signal transduction histidine kinase
LQHALAAIIGNAIRYSPEGGDVHISVLERRAQVVVSVRDAGIGVAPDRIKNVFRRYYQAHRTGLRGPAGLGISLYLCRETLRRMGGKIRIRSEGVGKGTEVTFTLPRHQEGTAT